MLLSFFLINTPIARPADNAGRLGVLIPNGPKKVMLDNGLTIIIKEVPPSGLVSIDARVMVGSAHEGDLSGSGISHFVEHMLFKGTPSRRPGDIEREIRALGGEMNGATTYDYTTFTITLPSEHLPYALDVLSDSLFNANMVKKELEKERSVILKEINLNRDEPMRHISRSLWELAYKSHAYRHPIIGHKALFTKLTRQDLLEHYHKWYVPNNMIITIVGDIEYDATLAELKKYFKGKDRSALQENALTAEKQQITKRMLKLEEELAISYFILGYKGVSLHHNDMAALDVLSIILGGGMSSRLNLSLYRKKELVYSVGTWNYTPRDPGLFIISGATDPEKLQPALGAIKEEITIIKKSAVTDDELERARAAVSANYIYSLEDLSDQARNLATSEMLTGNPNFAKEYLKAIEAVTDDDIKRVARAYLNDNTLSLVTLSPPEMESAPSAKKVRKERAIEKITLSNGLRCLLMEDHNLPVVAIMAACQAGLRAEDDQNAGLSSLTALMLTKGTKSRSEDDISKEIEMIGGTLVHFSGYNSSGIKLNILSKDLDKGLDIFKDMLLNSVFPEKVLEREKDTAIAAIDATDDDIFQAGMKRFKKLLFTEHPFQYQAVGTINTVENLNRENLEKFYKEYFIPNNMVLAVFGDIDKETIGSWVEETFSKIPKAPEPGFTSITEPQQVNIRQARLVTDKSQSFVGMGYKGALLKGRDHYLLRIISASLSGMSGRLAARLREGRGMTYAVGSFSVPALNPGFIMLYALTTSQNIKAAEDEFVRQVKLLNKKGLENEELSSIKKGLIGNFRIALQGNSSLAHHTVLDELYGLGYDNYLKFEKIVNSITNEQIKAAAKKYLKPDAATLIVLEGKRGE